MGLLTTIIAGVTLSDVTIKVAGKVTNYGVKRFIEKRADEFLDEARNKKDFEQRFMNHDLQRAVVRSYYKSIIKISEDCLEISNQQAGEYKENLIIINEAVKSIRNEINKKLSDLKLDPNPELPIPDYGDINALISNVSNLDETSKKQLKDELVKSALKFELPTALYEKLLNERLYDYICNFFSLELKENEKVYRIFTAQSLVNNEVILNQINFAVLNIADNTMETHEDVKKLFDMSLEMYSLLTTRKNLESTQFRINNAIHLEKLEKLSSVISDESICIFSYYTHLQKFLRKMELLEKGNISEEMEEKFLQYEEAWAEKEKTWTPDNPDSLAELVEMGFKNPIVEYRMEILQEFLKEINEDLFINSAKKFKNIKKECYSLQIKHGFGIRINLDSIILWLERLSKELAKSNGTAYSNTFYRLKNTFNGIEPLGDYYTKNLFSLAEELETIAVTLKNHDENILKALKDVLS
ncbi:hypothetical protein ACQKML_24060 [Peribacillus frigoritolerans]